MMAAYFWPNSLRVMVTLLVAVSPSLAACRDQSGSKPYPSPTAIPAMNGQVTKAAGSAIKAQFQMVTDQISDSGPTWTTNDSIRFSRVTDGQRYIGELHLNSGKVDLKPIAVPVPVTGGTECYWSPRSTYLILSQRFASPGLWLFDVKTGKASIIPPPGLDASDVWDVAWTPDESSVFVLVSREKTLAESAVEVPKKVVRIDPRTGTSVKVADLPSLSYRLALSPAGDVMLVSRLGYPGGPNSSSLLSLDVASSRVEELSLIGSERPKWSPDGRFVAYGSRGTFNDAYESGIWVAPSSMIGTRKITEFVKGLTVGDDSFFWLPDGKHLLLPNMTIVDVDSGETKQIEFSGKQPVTPYTLLGPWSPDGKKLLLGSAKGLGMITLGD